jgi:hypothetical protein
MLIPLVALCHPSSVEESYFPFALPNRQREDGVSIARKDPANKRLGAQLRANVVSSSWMVDELHPVWIPALAGGAKHSAKHMPSAAVYDGAEALGRQRDAAAGHVDQLCCPSSARSIAGPLDGCQR